MIPSVKLPYTAVLDCFNPLTLTVAVWEQLRIKHPVPDRFKPSFVIFDVRALWRSVVSVRVPGYQMTALPGLAHDAIPTIAVPMRQQCASKG